MSQLTTIENAIKDFFTAGHGPTSTISVDANKVLDLLNYLVALAPAIEKGIVSMEPFVEAIVTMIKNGGTPSDAQWADLKTRLDEGSAAIAAAAAEAQAELAAPEAAPGAPAEAPVAAPETPVASEPAAPAASDGGPVS